MHAEGVGEAGPGTVAGVLGSHSCSVGLCCMNQNSSACALQVSFFTGQVGSWWGVT